MISTINKAQRIGKYTLGIMGLRDGDVWLPSFPKTGSTWVRFLFCNLLSIIELNGEPVDFLTVSSIMPSLGRSNLLKPWEYDSIPRLIKTHQPYRAILFTKPKRSVYILRDPRDVMVSYFHFQQAKTINPFQGNFTEFIRHPDCGIKACLEHYTSWLPHVIHIICYENLLNDATEEFQRALISLQIDVPKASIELAVQRSAFDQIQKAQMKGGLPKPDLFAKEFQFARKGKSNQWPDYFQDKDLILYERLCEEYEFNIEALTNGQKTEDAHI